MVVDAAEAHRDDAPEVAVDCPGEIWFWGPIIMKEYWNKPKATADAITADGWFRTGDIGRVDSEGNVYIMDRAKDLIIRGGENISCAEVESAVYEYPEVAECAVFGRKDDRLGETVAVAITPVPTATRSSAAAAFEGLGNFLQSRLARFKIPDEVFVWEGQLPRGATGKIPKKTIREMVDAGRAGTPEPHVR